METLIFCAVLFVLLAVLLQPPTDHHVELFADRYDVPVTSNNAALLRSYIWWARMFRLGGFAVVVVVVVFVEKFWSIDIGGPVSLFTLEVATPVVRSSVNCCGRVHMVDRPRPVSIRERRPPTSAAGWSDASSPSACSSLLRCS